MHGVGKEMVKEFLAGPTQHSCRLCAFRALGKRITIVVEEAA